MREKSPVVLIVQFIVLVIVGIMLILLVSAPMSQTLSANSSVDFVKMTNSIITGLAIFVSIVVAIPVLLLIFSGIYSHIKNRETSSLTLFQDKLLEKYDNILDDSKFNPGNLEES